MSENLYFYQCTIDSAHSPKLQMERARRMASTTRSRKSKSIRRFIWSVGMSMHSCSSNSARQDSTNKFFISCVPDACLLPHPECDLVSVVVQSFQTSYLFGSNFLNNFLFLIKSDGVW